MTFDYAPRARFAIAAGALSGVMGALVFAAAHALIIVPIWDRMLSGLVFGALAGAAGGWALGEIRPLYASGTITDAAVHGAKFGALLWLLVAPVTAADALLRATGVAPRYELVAVAVALVLGVGAGWMFGWRTTHRRRAAVAGAAATLALVIAMAGPVPVARSARAFGIFAAVLPAAIVGGATTAALARAFARRAPSVQAE